ncbi:MAG: biopolymer transporter ExbD [Steroidobacteraceae bacterium]|nr:biopolymer transporter ExbD [Nevskiaceae bacterium]MCP5338939.1 biopolymer transporter ExbD [Nevskiaceae bacterium]MCP5359648.1 biopolymer transporter ExbD [Nevskiaceae bacterium]MCP5472558.1 biopolymer transporter ExbD [Nevskiaceae bacterium]
MRSLRGRRRNKTVHGGNHMVLVPFIDMMTILVVFLLVHTSDTEILPNTKNISIPLSIAETKPRPTVVVMVTQDTMYVNGRAVAQVGDVMSSEAPVIEPLRTALREQADRILVEAARENIVEREVTIMGDKSIPFRVLKRIMATCTDADYGKVSLAVIEREGGAPGAG